MELTNEQILFMEGEEPARAFGEWWPLLMAGHIRPNPQSGPPLFIVTPEGTEALAQTTQ